MFLIKEKSPLLGKSFQTGLHYFPVLDNLLLYNQHEAGINYAILAEEELWINNPMFTAIRSNAFHTIKFKMFGLFV